MQLDELVFAARSFQAFKHTLSNGKRVDSVIILPASILMFAVGQVNFRWVSGAMIEAEKLCLALSARAAFGRIWS